jgi:hypothetical protein
MSSRHPGTSCGMKTMFVLYSLLIVSHIAVAITVGLVGR